MGRTARIVLLCLGLAADRADAQVSAEPWFRAGTFMLTLEAGGAAFTDFTRSRARPLDGSVRLGDFERRVSARTAASLGASASYWFSNNWGVRAGLSYVPSRFRVWNDEEVQHAIAAIAPDARDTSYASLAVWSLTGGAVYRFPRSFGRVVPYGIVTAGWVWYRAGDTDGLPPEARGPFADGRVRQATALAGVGAVIPLQRKNLLMTFELTNHIARAPLDDSGAGERFELAGVPMQIDPDASTSGDGPNLTHQLRLAFGITLPIR